MPVASRLGCFFYTITDMVYVALAERNKTELITADESLRMRLSRLTWVVGPD